MTVENTGAKLQLLKDLSNRARGGIVIYTTIWLITAFWVDMALHAPELFYLNTGLFVTVSTLRLLHLYSLKSMCIENLDSKYSILVILILFSALHQGMLSAYIIYASDFQELHYPYMIILSAFAMGGTATLSISRLVGISFPILIFLPTLLMGSYVGGPENLVLATLAIISILYVLEGGRSARNDYQNAINNHQIAEERANQMEQLSITDPLTKLNNRMYFNKRLTEDWNHCLRLKSPISILMLDLDYFKVINDTYGHIAGDECLKLVSSVIKSEIQRTTDTLARYGGEEFVAILPHTDLSSSATIAGKLLKVISTVDYRVNGKKVPVTCSIGVSCTTPGRHRDCNSLLMAADKALYQAKESGRNRYCTDAPDQDMESEVTSQSK